MHNERTKAWHHEGHCYKLYILTGLHSPAVQFLFEGADLPPKHQQLVKESNNKFLVCKHNSTNIHGSITRTNETQILLITGANEGPFRINVKESLSHNTLGTCHLNLHVTNTLDTCNIKDLQFATIHRKVLN